MYKKVLIGVTLVIAVICTVGVVANAVDTDRFVRSEARIGEKDSNDSKRELNPIEDLSGDIATEEYIVEVDGVKYRFIAEAGLEVTHQISGNFSIARSENESLILNIITEQVWNDTFTSIDEGQVNNKLQYITGHATASQCSGFEYNYSEVDTGNRVATKFVDPTKCFMPSAEGDGEAEPMSYGAYGYALFIEENPFVYILMYDFYYEAAMGEKMSPVMLQIADSIEAVK